MPKVSIVLMKVISNSNKYSDDEKLEKLKELSESEAEAKRKCWESIKGNAKTLQKLQWKFLKAFCLAVYIFLLPTIIKKFKKALGIDADITLIETEPLISEDATNTLE